MRRLFAAAVLGAAALAIAQAGATWKPEFKDHSPALKSWFKNAKPTDWGQKEFGISFCCELAERVKTKFDVVKAGEGLEQWWFECTEETITFCTNRGKRIGEWAQVPPGVVHKEEIKTPTEYPASDGSKGIVTEPEREKVELEFQELRAKGVMFVYRGDIVCFWPPEFQG